ncbi:MAG: dihydrodipicolinate synthase family protein, partial [Acidobacteriaceae bacterium]
ILYSIPKFTHLDIPVEVAAELAQHPNIVAIKESSGSLERLSQLIAATRNAPRRTVLVTPVFAAYTNRMMTADTEASAALAAELVSIDGFGAGSPVDAAVMAAPRVKAMRKKEIGFQVLSGSAENLLPAFEAGVSGAVLAFAAPAPQACQEVYTAWKENDSRIAAEKQQRLIAASRLVAGKYGIPGLKHACDLNGYYGGVPRIPLLPLSAEQKAEVAAAMADVRN